MKHVLIFSHVFLYLQLLCKFCQSDSRFYPNGDDEHKFPKYPIQEYIQVRRTVSVEHVPRYGTTSGDYQSSSSTQSDKTPASSKIDPSGGSSTNNHESQENYHKPPLREEIFLNKKQEVYEERGYSDGHYDHSGYGENYQDKNHGPQQGQYETAASSRQYKNPVGWEQPSSSKVLKHIATNLYDRDGHAMGFYQARSNVYCPEVIDFDLSAKSQKMGVGGRPKGKPRLGKLGSKIACLKRKYFGEEMLPSSVFPSPAVARKSAINFGTLDDFWADMKRNFH